MRPQTGLNTLLLIAGLLPPGAISGQQPALPVAPETTAQPVAPRVAEVTLARPDSARAQFSIQGEGLLFERLDSSGWTQLWTVRRDGTFERCLTCDNPDFNNSHTGAGQWHPSGDLIAFLVERPAAGKRRGNVLPTPFLATPGVNRGNDVWLAARDGRRFWNLTNSASRGGNRVHIPAFSHEGDHLAWSEREGSDGSEWGTWLVQVGRFRFSRATPRLAKVTAHRFVRPGFVEVVGFAADDQAVDLAGPPLQPPLSVKGQDLYRLPLTAGAEGAQAVAPWTESPTAWDGHLAFSRDGRWAVFASTRGLPPQEMIRAADGAFAPVTELWIADPAGYVLERLTGFNDPTSDHYLGERAHIGPAEWTPEGDALLVTVTPRSTGRSSLFRLDLVN